MFNLAQPIYMKTFVTLIFILYSSVNAFSQGCSDAGFCTMGAMKPDQPYNKKIQLKLRSMELSFYRGTTTTTPIIYVATADFNFSLNAKSSLQVKVPYTMVRSGNLGDNQGVSDLSLCYTRSLLNTDRFDINFSLGGKIPTNRSNQTSNKFAGEP